MAQTFSQDNKSKSNLVVVSVVLLLVMAVISSIAVIVASAAKLVLPSLNYPASIFVATVILMMWMISLLRRARADK